MGICMPGMLVSIFCGAVVVVGFCVIFIPGIFCIAGFLAAVEVVLGFARPRPLALRVPDIFMPGIFIPGMLLMLCLLAVGFFFVFLRCLCVLELFIFIPGMFCMSCPAKMSDVNVKMIAIIAATFVTLLNCMIPPV